MKVWGELTSRRAPTCQAPAEEYAPGQRLPPSTGCPAIHQRDTTVTTQFSMTRGEKELLVEAATILALVGLSRTHYIVGTVPLSV